MLKYDEILPNVGLVFDFTPQISVFANYAKGLSVPSTDNLYNAFFFPEGSDAAKPDPETTDSFDLGLRYRSSKIQAQLRRWFTKFKNRSASAFDPELNHRSSATSARSTMGHRRLDRLVTDQGSSRSMSSARGTIRRSRTTSRSAVRCRSDRDLRQRRSGHAATGVRAAAPSPPATASSARRNIPYGCSAVGTLGPVDLGITAKRTGPRYIFDNNQPMFRGDVDLTTPSGDAGDSEQIFGKTAPAYWLVNLDARLNLATCGTREDLLPAQRLQPVRQILCRRFRRRPEPVAQRVAASRATRRSFRSVRRGPSAARSASVLRIRPNGGVVPSGAAPFPSDLNQLAQKWRISAQLPCALIVSSRVRLASFSHAHE